MKGRNEIHLCPLQVNEALQYYFDNVLFREGMSPIVEGVKTSGEKGLVSEPFFPVNTEHIRELCMISPREQNTRIV